MKRNLKGMLLIAACVTLWSFTGLLTKAIPWNGVALAGWRGLVSACVMYGYMRATKAPLLHTRRALLIGFCVAAAALFCLMANKLTTAANAIMIQYTAPIFLIVLSALIYKTKYGVYEYAVVAVTLLGVVLFFFDKLTPGNILGNLCALGCGMTYGGMYLFSEGAAQEERLSGILWGFLFTGLVGAPFLFFTDCAVTLQSVGMVLLMGGVFYGLPYVLYALSLRDCPALAAILISTIEIILNPVWVYLFLGEKPGPWAFVGSAVILSAVTVYSIHNVKKASAQRKA